MVKSNKDKITTIPKLARATQEEFLAVRKDISGLRENMQEGFSTIRQEIVGEVRDVVREENAKIIVSNDKVAIKLDDLLKDRAADKLLHDRHERRLEKLEAKIR